MIMKWKMLRLMIIIGTSGNNNLIIFLKYSLILFIGKHII